MNFSGQHVLITGGTKGIGRATAFAFAKQGANVILNYSKDEYAAAEALENLPPGDHRAIKADITQPDEVRQLVNQVIRECGKIDVVVNNAGFYQSHPIDLVNYEAWQESWEITLSVNLMGAANVCYCVAQYMRLAGGGRIINISSRGAFRGEPDHPAYGASKAGLNAMSQSLAQSLAKYNIYVGVVAPGFVETDMAKAQLDGPEGDAIRAQSPLGRVARPEEVAQAVLFLASKGTEFMTGAILDVNGASYLRS